MGKLLDENGLTHLISLIKTALNGKQNTLTLPLSTSNGGTGNTSGKAASATKLATGRTLKVNLGSTSASTAFDGTANISNIGVSGTLAVGNGGTGQTSLANVSVGSATTATKLGSATVGGTAKPIYLSSGTATALSSTVGGTKKPVYLNGGTITAISETVGSATQPIYLNNGTATACTYTLGATVNAGTADKLAYYSGAKAVSAYTSTAGAANKICYLNAGVPTDGITISYGSTLPSSGNTGDVFILIS